MGRDYLPTADAEFDLWQLNFNGCVQESAGTYGLDASYAAALGPLSQDFHEKLAIARTADTRTSVSIAAKDSVRAALKNFIRLGVRIVQSTAAVTNSAKEALRIPIHKDRPSRIPAPITFPRISASLIGTRLSLIRISDTGAGNTRAGGGGGAGAGAGKPDGVIGMALFGRSVAAGEAPITEPTDLKFIAIMSRTRLRQQWPAAEAGRTMCLAGAWITRTGQRGPWSAVVTCGVAA